MWCETPKVKEEEERPDQYLVSGHELHQSSPSGPLVIDLVVKSGSRDHRRPWPPAHASHFFLNDGCFAGLKWTDRALSNSVNVVSRLVFCLVSVACSSFSSWKAAGRRGPGFNPINH